MTHVSIIGTGNMGRAIAGIVTAGGNTVEVFNQSDAGNAVTGDIVVLAVPYPALADVLAKRGDQLAGKVVVDITNPLNVLKAFNTTFAATLAAGTTGPLPTTVLIAGDDADAKALLAGVVTTGGLLAIDAGGLRRARELEALGFLQLTLAVGEKVAWSGGFGVVV